MRGRDAHKMLLYFQYLVLMCVCPVACLFAHGKICLRTRKSSAFLLSRFIFLTYLLGIIHILHTLIYIHIQIYRCCSVFRDGVAAVDAGVRLPYSSHKHTYKHTHTHTNEMRIEVLYEKLTVRIVIFCWPFRGALLCLGL